MKNIPGEAFEFQRNANPEYKFQKVSPNIFPYLLVNIGSGVSILKVSIITISIWLIKKSAGVKVINVLILSLLFLLFLLLFSYLLLSIVIGFDFAAFSELVCHNFH